MDCQRPNRVNPTKAEKAAKLAKATKRLPTKPGFYWALWETAAPGTNEGEELTPSKRWEVVEVWENFLGDPCEADRAEKFAVSVPGVREAQWIENFVWGQGPLERGV